MVIAKGDGLLLLGLTAENIHRLIEGDPIRITEESHGAAAIKGLTIIIVADETDTDIYKVLRKVGAVDDSTVVTQPKAM